MTPDAWPDHRIPPSTPLSKDSLGQTKAIKRRLNPNILIHRREQHTSNARNGATRQATTHRWYTP